MARVGAALAGAGGAFRLAGAFAAIAFSAAAFFFAAGSPPVVESAFVPLLAAAVRGAAGVLERDALALAVGFGLLSSVRVGVRDATGSSPPLAGRGGRRVDRLLELLAFLVQHLELTLEPMDVLFIGLEGTDADE